ncbi:MAG: winged helix-turn-helix domain-containing protein [Prevotella sp.]|uniref:winged helix-turn-helix domain-containing protein n=1 Tax=Prevotella sp. TaxID=59823 RepID=UPI002A3262E0|nr:winged helix-turn-helix domain-containing protein [Prevotella sp.]MDD7318315.1 winged helix-turn-helix domain-containing protein [Prevotellaceae bacterium]MDY4019681.1 winged helix-turn-helix domain-containing protein [Prevotella sp.]
MAEQKKTKVAVSTTAKKTATAKNGTVKKVTAKKQEVAINAVNVGFKAGDVYQALASEAKPLTVADIEKTAKISHEEVLLGLGWLLKEGKVKDENEKIVLA